MNDIMLEVQDLKTYFYTRRGVVKAVDGVNFYLRRGESIGIVGESGCGKTVTALSLLRLVPKDAGRIVGGKILLNNEDLLSKSEKEMRQVRGKQISMILQDPMSSLNPAYTIGNQVGEAIQIHQGLKGSALLKKTCDMLRLLRIASPEVRVRDFPHQMSGGIKQRIVGAIALSCQPSVLIADEPTTSLDVTIQAQYLELLSELQKETKVSIIFITHDLGIVAQMCKRVYVMYAGKIMEHAPTVDLFKHPRHPYTQALLKSVPSVDKPVERLFSIEGQPPTLHDVPAGCAFHPRCWLAEEKCHESTPPTVDIGPNHRALCWRLQEGSK